MNFLKMFFNKPKGAAISSLTSDLKPDSWATFYLFYFNQGIGSDASFIKDNILIHLFVGTLLSEQNNATILNTISTRHELAAGEFMHILTKLTDDDLSRLKSTAGAALNIDQGNGKAYSHFFHVNEEIKEYVSSLRKKGAVQLNEQQT